MENASNFTEVSLKLLCNETAHLRLHIHETLFKLFFSMPSSLTYRHKCCFRSLKTELLVNSFQSEDIKKVCFQCLDWQK